MIETKARATASRAVAVTATLVLAPIVLLALVWYLFNLWLKVPASLFLLILMALEVVTISSALLMARRDASAATAPLVEGLARVRDQADLVGDAQVVAASPLTGLDDLDRIVHALDRRSIIITKKLSTERQFASDASHQLRTPLTSLMMRLEEITFTKDIDAAHEEANAAIDQCERLAGVIADLLGRTKTASGNDAASVSLDKVLAALAREWHPAFEKARRAIHISGERSLQVTSSESMLAQVLATLLENSLAHGGGTVEVNARRSGPSIVVEVSDEGPGIDAELAPRIFERSVSSSSSTGLGLGLARDLAEASGGRLELVSPRPVVFALFLSEAVIR